MVKLDEFSSLRPFLYHLTSIGNLSSILKEAKLFSASTLLAEAGHGGQITEKRKLSIKIKTKRGLVDIRDQAPLHRGNVTLNSGWDFTDLLKSLNSRVYFWPGRSDGPISYGVRHFERYAEEPPIILRFRTRELLLLNEGRVELCKYNSGSPRCTKGKGSPRGSNTFHTLVTCELRPSQIVEVTVRDYAALPPRVDVSENLGRTWKQKSL